MLKIQFKDRRQEAVWLVDQVFSIGKHSRNSLVIDQQGIADFHAELINRANQLTLINKADGTGIWVNGTPISDHIALAAGDQLTLADVELELVDPKQEPVVNEKATRSEWSISSRASWLEQPRFQINAKVIIGRDPSCDIVLPLEHLSRQHVCLELRNGQLFARDLGSANGTYVNGERINEVALNAGDKLKIDVITFEVGGPSHDPHKTIIRSVSSPKKTKVKGQPTPASNAQPKQVVSNKRRNAPQKKRLAAQGKQDWLSGDNESAPEKSESKSGVWIVAGLILCGVATAIALTQL